MALLPELEGPDFNFRSRKLDTLKFRVTNPSIGYKLQIENIFLGLETCYINPFLQSQRREGSRDLRRIDLGEVEISKLGAKLPAISLTNRIFEIEGGETVFFSSTFSQRRIASIAQSLNNSSKCPPNDKRLPIGTVSLFLSYIDSDGKHQILSTILYNPAPEGKLN